MKNRNYVLIFLVAVFSMSLVFAQISHCCEKTTYGAWCMDEEEDMCDTDYLMEPTACISTSYCSLGTCINKKTGECIPNTPQRSCDEEEFGFWSEDDPEDIPQCQLGCCFVGDQAAFVTQTKCKSFASIYGIDTHFQSNIQDELTCIASAFPDEKGACVFEREFETTCKMTTRSECQGISDAVFHEGFLCTADELATDCAPTDQTTCVEGRDEVFFLDSCGNTANVYDIDMISEQQGQIVPNGADGDIYWTKIMAPVCGDGAGSISSKDCGDCNYYDGSTCKEYNRQIDTSRPAVGDYICRDLGCEFDSDRDGTPENYEHGESWCALTPGTNTIDVSGGILKTTSLDSRNTNLPGSRFVRMVCYNGEVTSEPCADRRAEICIQSTKVIEERGNLEFTSATCRVNRWQDCVAQEKPEDCEDSAIRDCQWISIEGGKDGGDNYPDGKCAPLVSPGFAFWDSSSDSSDICSVASTTCTAHYTQSLAQSQSGSWSQEDGQECFNGNRDYEEDWGKAQNQYCVSLGDCKGSVTEDEDSITKKIKNYLGFSP